MEEAVWGPNRPNVDTSVEVLDSNSTLKTYPKKEQTSVWKRTKTALNLIFNSLAFIGWALIFVILFDVLFNNATLFTIFLAGY